jgi:hypothetical protein
MSLADTEIPAPVELPTRLGVRGLPTTGDPENVKKAQVVVLAVKGTS